MPGPVFFNTSPACLRQPDERCRPACTNRLPSYMVRLVRLCSRHRLFTELALDKHVSWFMAWRLGKAAPRTREGLPSAPAQGVAAVPPSRDFYIEHPEVAALTDEQVRQIREELGIVCLLYTSPSPRD